MKRIVGIVFIIVLSLLGAAVVQAEEEELDIRIEALKERQYSSVALTDQYETEILTERSNEYSAKITEIKEKKTKQLVGQLFLNIDEKEDYTLQIQEQTINAGLFADGYSAKNTSGNITQKDNNTVLIIVCTIGCIAAGYLLAVAWHRFREGQK